ncbi:MAG: hypothetical protein N4A33_02925 [Bacteriovoracaceae bacterium]|jgi:hypothetical protein|nr:hypothetical protein [Bacteriovoracaceae bacterium]
MNKYELELNRYFLNLEHKPHLQDERYLKEIEAIEREKLSFRKKLKSLLKFY